MKTFFLLLILLIPSILLPQDFEEIREKITRLTADVEELKKQRKPKLLRNALFSLGELYVEDHLFRRAAEVLQETIDLEPGKKMLKKLYPLLGISFEELKEYDKAIPVYQKAKKLSPKDTDIYLRLAHCFLQVELFDNAFEHYQKVVSLDETNTRAYEGLGKVYKTQGFFDKAVSMFEQSLAFKPGNDTIYLELSDIYERRGQLDLAIDMQQSAIKVLPSVERYVRLGFLHTLNRDYDAALKHFSHARDLNPNYEDIYLHIGVIAFKKNDFSKALESLSQAVSINPTNALVYFYRARVLYRSGNIEEAINDIEKAHTYAESQMLSRYTMQLLDKLKSVADTQ